MPTPQIPRIKNLKAAFADVVTVHGFVDWRGASSYEDAIEALFPDIHALIKEGLPDAAVEVVEYAMGLLEKNWSKVDDSSGGMSMVFETLQIFHLKACKDAKPEPKALAKRLFEWAMTSDYDAFHKAPETYKGVLGKVGMAELGRLIDAEFAKVPKGEQGDIYKPGRGSFFKIKAWAKMYAEQTKDFDRALAVLTRDLSSPYRYLEVAEACKAFGKVDLAIEWAEEGLKAFPKDIQDSRLRSFLAVEYEAMGRIEDAYSLLWENFETSRHQYLDAYQVLKTLGTKIGRWAEWQERAMGLLRAGKSFAKDADAIVAVLVFEGLLKEAYAEANMKGCTEYGWKGLAEALTKAEPNLSYEAHRQLFGKVMDDYTSTTARTNLAWTVKQMSRLAGIIGVTKEFKAWLEEQKTINKRRTGFLNDLKGMGL